MLGFATEIESAQWLLPSVDGEPYNDELAQLIGEMEGYSPSSHAGDRLMAALMAREAAAKHFDIFEQHEAAAQAELDLYAAYGIVVPPEERALIEGRSGFVDINVDVLLGKY